MRRRFRFRARARAIDGDAPSRPLSPAVSPAFSSRSVQLRRERASSEAAGRRAPQASCRLVAHPADEQHFAADQAGQHGRVDARGGGGDVHGGFGRKGRGRGGEKKPMRRSADEENDGPLSFSPRLHASAPLPFPLAHARARTQRHHGPALGGRPQLRRAQTARPRGRRSERSERGEPACARACVRIRAVPSAAGEITCMPRRPKGKKRGGERGARGQKRAMAD